MSEKAGVEATAYTIRHTFVTDGITNGVDVVTPASIIGHKDLTMVYQVYQHVSMKQDHIQEALQKAVGRTSPLVRPGHLPSVS